MSDKTVVEEKCELRDSFARAALTGFLANSEAHGVSGARIVEVVYALADAMLEESERFYRAAYESEMKELRNVAVAFAKEHRRHD